MLTYRPTRRLADATKIFFLGAGTAHQGIVHLLNLRSQWNLLCQLFPSSPENLATRMPFLPWEPAYFHRQADRLLTPLDCSPRLYGIVNVLSDIPLRSVRRDADPDFATWYFKVRYIFEPPLRLPIPLPSFLVISNVYLSPSHSSCPRTLSSTSTANTILGRPTVKVRNDDSAGSSSRTRTASIACSSITSRKSLPGSRADRSISERSAQSRK